MGDSSGIGRRPAEVTGSSPVRCTRTSRADPSRPARTGQNPGAAIAHRLTRSSSQVKTLASTMARGIAARSAAAQIVSPLASTNPPGNRKFPAMSCRPRAKWPKSRGSGAVVKPVAGDARAHRRA